MTWRARGGLGNFGAGMHHAAHGDEVAFTLNGAPLRVRPRAGESLLETLRERCGITSVKDGCHPQGQCGACLALVDGHPRITCTLPTHHAHEAEVVTLEGLPEDQRARVARAFVEAAGGGQCGFCVPAIALHATSLVERHPHPTRAEIAHALDLHLCRCSGYVRLIKAVELLARFTSDSGAGAGAGSDSGSGSGSGAGSGSGGVGAAVPRLGAAEQVLGQRAYVADLVRPGMLRGAVALSAHARARAVRIDVAKAAALPGVIAVVTAADVPGERWYGLIEQDWPAFVAEGEEVRCAGDVLAAVAAVDEATARAAAGLVEVQYEPLSPVLDPEASLADGAPRVNPRHSNVLSRSSIRRGDAVAALAASAHVARGTFRTQRVEHLFLEPECALAEPLPDGGIRLYSQGQGVFDDRRQIARLLAMPEERVVVELVPNGGAFGGKEDLSIQAHAALLAWKTGRAVRVSLSREESVRMHPKRHPMTLDYEVGCDAEGRLTAVRARLVGDSGAYASVGGKVLERAAGHACGPYRVPCVDVEAVAAYTNNPPSGAMRGFGVCQAAFALEGCIDELAEKMGVDPWEMRYRNAVDAGDAVTTGQVLERSVGIKRTLEAVKGAYDEARRAGRAAGIACAIKNSGIGNGVPEHGRARLVVNGDGSVALYNGFTEMGQGLFTALSQIAAEVSGLPVTAFRPRVDTTAPMDCGQTTASRGTLLGGRAVIEAARRLRADLDAGRPLAELAGRAYDGEIAILDTTPIDTESGRIKTHTAYGFATQVVVLDEKGRVARVVAAHDVGRAVNPGFCAGQVEGAIHMGLGYALTEELECPGGIPATSSPRELGALRAHDMPEVEVILVEEPEPEGPFGAKGVGEIGLVPTAAAVAGALAAFDGVRRRTLPMRDSPAALAMSVGPHHRHGHHHHDHRREP